MDVGTLYQLRNTINHRNANSPSDNFTACEDFFILVVEAHIIAAAMEAFGMKSAEDSLDKKYFPDGVKNMESKEKLQVLNLAIDLVINEFVSMSYGEHEEVNTAGEDHVQAYASSLLNLGLLYIEFNNGIREGDGYRILRCWCYFLLYFKFQIG